MGNEKFTPGEWEFIGGGIYVGDTHIAEVYASYNSDYEGEQEANANLIAAAPEMYRMLIRAFNMLDGTYIGGEMAKEIDELLQKSKG